MTKSSSIRNSSFIPLNFAITSLCFVDTHLLIPILALYASGLGASVGMIGLIIGLYSIINVPANIFFGRVIDKVGYKKPLILGLLGDALSMFFYSLCRLPVHLALLRSFHGLTGGIAGPATMSITAQYSIEDQKGKAMSFYGMAIATATLIGYGLSGILASRLGYTSVFYFGSGLLLIATLLALTMPRNKGTSSAKVKIPVKEQLNKIASLFRRRGLTASYCSIFAQYFAFGGVVTLLPLYIKRLGMEAFHVGMLLTIFCIIFILLQYPSGVISDRVGRLIPTTIGLSLGIISLIMLPNVGTFTTLAIIMVLYGMAYAILFPSVAALVADYSSIEERGMATGIFHALITVGVALGAPIMGWVGESMGVEAGIALSSSIIAVALVITIVTSR